MPNLFLDLLKNTGILRDEAKQRANLLAAQLQNRISPDARQVMTNAIQGGIPITQLPQRIAEVPKNLMEPALATQKVAQEGKVTPETINALLPFIMLTSPVAKTSTDPVVANLEETINTLNNQYDKATGTDKIAIGKAIQQAQAERTKLLFPTVDQLKAEEAASTKLSERPQATIEPNVTKGRMGDVYYHVTTEKRISSIEKEGIKAPIGKMWKKGKEVDIPQEVYVWKDKKDAEWFQKYLSEQEGQKAVIKEVNLKGLKMRPDPETADLGQWDSRLAGKKGSGFIVEGNIPPERLNVAQPPITGKLAK